MKKPVFSDDINYWSNIYTQNTKKLFMPTVFALVQNVYGLDIGTAEKFLFDTGASISILNSRYTQLFNYQQIDTVQIQYGQGLPKLLPVYDAKLMIKGVAYRLKCAVDSHLRTNSLLGNIDFFDTFRSITLSYNKKKIHFYI